MIKSALVRRIAEQNPHLYAKDIGIIVNAIFDEVTAALAKDDTVGQPRVKARAAARRAAGRRGTSQPRPGF